MKKILLLAALFCTSTSFAQTSKEKIANSYQDISAGAGIYMNNRDESLQHGTVYTVDYGQFSYSNIGFRGGISYIDQIGHDVSMIGTPLRFAWRSGIDRRNKQEKLATAATSFIDNDGSLPSALINLAPLRFEVNGGITPMIATSHGGTTYGWSSQLGDHSEELSVKHNFALSADIGARLSIRIWRINLFFEPQYHYWLTDNFTHTIKTQTSTKTYEPKRSYMSLLVGANFIL